MSVTVRDAVFADAAAIAYVHYHGWQQSYKGLLPDSFLQGRSIESSREHFEKRRCENMAVAEVDGKIVGFCGWGDFRGDENMGEIYAIYLLDEYKRRGIGSMMMDHAVQKLKEMGHGKVGLWVLKNNESAILFYEKVGFSYTGEDKQEDMGEVITESLYTKQI